jgi:hypothetical protein
VGFFLLLISLFCSKSRLIRPSSLYIFWWCWIEINFRVQTFYCTGACKCVYECIISTVFFFWILNSIIIIFYFLKFIFNFNPSNQFKNIKKNRFK